MSWFATPSLRFSIEVPEHWPFDAASVFRDLALAPGDEHRDDDRLVRRYRIELAGAPYNPDPEAPTAGTLYIDDAAHAECKSSRTLHQHVIADLGNHLVDAFDGLVIHGVTVARHGVGALLTAPSTHGKSTMSGKLITDGWGLVAEDICRVDATSLRVESFHRPLGLSEASLDLLSIEPPTGAGVRCGCGGKMLVPASTLQPLATASPVGVVGIVDRRQDEVVPLTPAAALHRMIQLGVAPYPDPERDLDSLARLLANAQCLAVGTANLDAASTAIAEAANTPVTEPVPSLVETTGEQFTVYLGTEAVVIADNNVHLLNQTAAAVLLLGRDGLDDTAIAAELDVPVDTVHDAAAVLDEAGVQRRSD